MAFDSIAVSVVIPVYNVASFIKRTISSLLSQSLDSVELIFVDDCSTDDSIKTINAILQEYLDSPKSIKFLYNEKNSGPSCSRNNGLIVAKGEYVFFCDSDDWLENTALELLYDHAKNEKADFVYCDFFMNYKNEEVYTKSVPFSSNKKVFTQYYLMNGWPVVWNKLYRRDFLISHNLKFDERFVFCEDLLFTTSVLNFSTRYSYLNKALYHYNRCNMKSITNTLSIDSKVHNTIQNGIDVLSIIIEEYRKKELFNHIQQELAWNFLKAKAPLIFYKNRRIEYCRLYPEFDKYVWSNPLLSYKMKILQIMMRYRVMWKVIDVICLIMNR